jgi:NitT/TauT family transport system substrate-binding protein
MRFPLLAAFAVAALLVHGGAATAAPTELRPLTLGIGGTAQIGYVTMTLADRLGYYRDAGLKITFANFQGGTKSVEALVGGSVDVVGGAYDNILILQSKGIMLTTIFNCVHNYGYVFGMLPARAGEYHSPKDLKGMKIGVSAPGSATENLVRILLGKASLSINDIATIGVGLGAGSIAALTSGRVDAVVTGEPDITRMIMDHEFVALVDTRTKAGMDYAYGGQAAGAGSFMTRDFIAAHRDLVQAYVTALYRAQR